MSSPGHQGGPRKGLQNSFTAAATAPLMLSRRSGESDLELFVPIDDRGCLEKDLHKNFGR